MVNKSRCARKSSRRGINCSSTSSKQGMRHSSSQLFNINHDYCRGHVLHTRAVGLSWGIAAPQQETFRVPLVLGLACEFLLAGLSPAPRDRHHAPRGHASAFLVGMRTVHTNGGVQNRYRRNRAQGQSEDPRPPSTCRALAGESRRILRGS